MCVCVCPAVCTLSDSKVAASMAARRPCALILRVEKRERDKREREIKGESERREG